MTGAGNWTRRPGDLSSVRFVQRRALAAVAAAVVLWAALGLVAPVASAHTDLVSSDPANGAELTMPPSQVTLTFAGEPMSLGATIIVVDADDQRWTDGDAVVSGTTVTAPLRSGAADGWYQVRWRIVSADGDVVSGAFDYGVGDLTGKDPVRLSRSGATPTDGDFDIAPLEPLHREEPGTSDATTDDGAGRLLLVGVIGALAGIAAFAVGAAVLRGRRTDATRAASAEPEPAGPVPVPDHSDSTDPSNSTDSSNSTDPTNSTSKRELTP